MVINALILATPIVVALVVGVAIWPAYLDNKLRQESLEDVIVIQPDTEPEIYEPQTTPHGNIRIQWSLDKVKACEGVGVAWAFSLTQNFRQRLTSFETTMDKQKCFQCVFSYPVDRLPDDCYRLWVRLQYQCNDRYSSIDTLDGPKFCTKQGGYVPYEPDGE